MYHIARGGLAFLRTFQTVLQRDWTLFFFFSFSSAMARLPVAVHACRCFYFGRPRGRGVAARCALIFTSSLMASNVESLLMCLFIIRMSSLTERLHTSFAHFQTGFLKTVEV